MPVALPAQLERDAVTSVHDLLDRDATALFGRLAELPYQRPTVPVFSCDRASRHLSTAMERSQRIKPDAGALAPLVPGDETYPSDAYAAWPLTRTRHEAHILRH